MSRTHAEIQRLSDRIGAHLALAQTAGAIQPHQVDDLLACLYGLYTLLRLHFVQEEENYFTLTEDEPQTTQTHRRQGDPTPRPRASGATDGPSKRGIGTYSGVSDRDGNVAGT